MCTARSQIAKSKSKLHYDWQSVSMSWYRVLLWNLRLDIISCRNVAVWNLRSCIYWAPSLTRGRVCNLQCNHSIVRVAQNPKSYSEASSTYISVDVLRRTKCRHLSQQFMYCCDYWLPWKFCLSGCCLDTNLRKRYLGSDLVTCGRFLWKVPTSVC
jgi:hypothetical protein